MYLERYSGISNDTDGEQRNLLLLLAGVGVEVDPRGEDAAHDSKEEHRLIE